MQIYQDQEVKESAPQKSMTARIYQNSTRNQRSSWKASLNSAKHLLSSRKNPANPSINQRSSGKMSLNSAKHLFPAKMTLNSFNQSPSSRKVEQQTRNAVIADNIYNQVFNNP